MSGGTGQAGTRSFSQQGYKRGDLKRHLTTVTLAYLTNSAPIGSVDTGTYTWRLVLKNLNADLTGDISVAPIGLNASNRLEASNIPAGAVRMQLTPVKIFPDAPPVFLRPVFQDPTLVSTDNANHPLPMDCPFGWVFSNEVVDDIYIDVTVNAALFAQTQLNGTIAVQVAVEYSGAWNYPEAAVYALNQVQLMGMSQPLTISTVIPG